MLEQSDQLGTLIASVRRRWFLTVALRTAGTATSVAAVPGFAAALMYWLFAPSGAGA